MYVSSFIMMKDEMRNKYFYRTFRPINLALISVGLTIIFGSQKHKNGNALKKNLKFSIFRMMYQFLVALIILIFTACVIYFHYFNLGKLEDIHLFQLIITALGAVINLFVTEFNLRRNAQNILQRMLHLDKLLKIDNRTYNENAVFLKRLIIIPVTILFALTLSDFVTYSIDLVTLQYTISIDFSIYIHLIFTIQYVSFIYVLRDRFKLLNYYIVSPKIINGSSRRIFYSRLGIIKLQENRYKTLLLDEFSYLSEEQISIQNNFGIMLTSIDKSYRQKLHYQLLRVAHASLCDISSLIINMNGFQAVIYFIIIFTESTSNLYYSIFHIAKGNNSTISKTINMLIMAPIWSLYHFVVMLLLTWSCNLASDEANRTGVLLHRLLLIPELQPDIVTEIQLFLQQVSYNKVKFTAWDIFTIDLKILGSIVGGVTTLLVIFVQFNKIV